MKSIKKLLESTLYSLVIIGLLAVVFICFGGSLSELSTTAIIISVLFIGISVFLASIYIYSLKCIVENQEDIQNQIKELKQLLKPEETDKLNSDTVVEKSE